MTEIWKDIPNYKDLYQASDSGHIRFSDTKKLLLEHKNPDGHLRVYFTEPGGSKCLRLDELILETFEGPSLDGPRSNDLIELYDANYFVYALEENVDDNWIIRELNCLYSDEAIVQEPDFMRYRRLDTFTEFERLARNIDLTSQYQDFIAVIEFNEDEFMLFNENANRWNPGKYKMIATKVYHLFIVKREVALDRSNGMDFCSQYCRCELCLGREKHKNDWDFRWEDYERGTWETDYLFCARPGEGYNTMCMYGGGKFENSEVRRLVNPSELMVALEEDFTIRLPEDFEKEIIELHPKRYLILSNEEDEVTLEGLY